MLRSSSSTTQEIGGQLGQIACLPDGTCASGIEQSSQLVTIAGHAMTGYVALPNNMLPVSIAGQASTCIAAGGFYDTHATGDELGSVYVFTPPAG